MWRYREHATRTATVLSVNDILIFVQYISRSVVPVENWMVHRLLFHILVDFFLSETVSNVLKLSAMDRNESIVDV